MKEGGLLCWIPKWNSAVFLVGITWWGFSLCIQWCPSLSCFQTLSSQILLYLFWRLFFCFACLNYFTMDTGTWQEKWRRKRTMKCNKVSVQIQTDFQTGCSLLVCFVHTVYLRSALDREWTYAVLTVHLSYWIVCRIVYIFICTLCWLLLLCLKLTEIIILLYIY